VVVIVSRRERSDSRQPTLAIAGWSDGSSPIGVFVVAKGKADKRSSTVITCSSPAFCKGEGPDTHPGLWGQEVDSSLARTHPNCKSIFGYECVFGPGVNGYWEGLLRFALRELTGTDGIAAQ
jgi:hypothetical protein